MPRRVIPILFFLILICTGPVWSQQINYLYPAGGCRGTSFEILIGGQQVMRANQVYVTGRGVTAEVLERSNGFRLNEANERYVITTEFIKALKKYYDPADVDKLIRAQKPKDADELVKLDNIIKKRIWIKRLSEDFESEAAAKSFLQRFYYEHYMSRPDRFLPNQRGNLLLVRITIDSDAEPGWRQLRISGQQNVSNSVPFHVTTIPEVCEVEPNDPEGISFVKRKKKADAPRLNSEQQRFQKFFTELAPQDLPIVFNGQIRAGDTDRFQFKAEKGQKLVFACWGRYLSPYLADAVPGWFAPVFSLYDPDGKKIASADSWRFDPDPILLFEVPRSGNYSLDIQDSLFRGRDDFVYRLAIGEFPFVTSTSSLGIVRPKELIELAGWNLPVSKINPDNYQVKKDGTIKVDRLADQELLYPLTLAAEDLPVKQEEEADKPLELPVILDGRIGKPNEIDTFRFKGHQGEKAVIDVSAIRLGSRLDAKIELLDPNGKLIAENDDRADEKGPNIGLETQHADPYILTKLPSDGIYTVRIYDLLNLGGTEYGYRIRLSAPQPDFSVYAYPPVLRFRAGCEPVQFVVIRKDGFAGTVEINGGKTKMKSGETLSLECSGASFPAGVESAVCTLSCSGKGLGVASVPLTASAKINGKVVKHSVIPAEYLEQAFIYHHLVPKPFFTIIRRYISASSVLAEPKTSVQFEKGKPAELEFTIGNRGVLATYLAQKEKVPGSNGDLRKKDGATDEKKPGKNEKSGKKGKKLQPNNKVSEKSKDTKSATNSSKSNDTAVKEDSNRQKPPFDFNVVEPKNIAIEHWEFRDRKLHFTLTLLNAEEAEKSMSDKGNLVIALLAPQISNDPTKKTTFSVREHFPAVSWSIKKTDEKKR